MLVIGYRTYIEFKEHASLPRMIQFEKHQRRRKADKKECKAVVKWSVRLRRKPRQHSIIKIKIKYFKKFGQNVFRDFSEMKMKNAPW